MNDEVKKLQKALEAGSTNGSLINGSPIVVEDLDLSKMGLYREIDSSTSDDYFPAEEKLGSLGVGYFMRKSEEGTKWVTYQDSGLKLHKDLK